jgi:hypothetical protein
MTVVGRATPMQSRDERVFLARTVTAATFALKGGCKVAVALAGLLTIMIALVALDVWIWVPHFN